MLSVAFMCTGVAIAQDAKTNTSKGGAKACCSKDAKADKDAKACADKKSSDHCSKDSKMSKADKKACCSKDAKVAKAETDKKACCSKDHKN